MSANVPIERIEVNKKHFGYIRERLNNGSSLFAFCGGRRSGKTYAICQFLLQSVYNDGDIVNIASMTQEQGRLGAYADCKTIISNSDGLRYAFEVMSSPQEIRTRHNSGKIFFNSYKNSETAKGVACDWLFVNEANNFSRQQVVDLMANVRKGIFFDYNPTAAGKFWITDYLKASEISYSTWKDNKKFLTALQLQYFSDLKRLGGYIGAPPVHRRNYLMYYEGVYSEVMGDIFAPEYLQFVKQSSVPFEKLCDYIVFCDPSALRGSDFFACVLAARDRLTGTIYFLDTYSINKGDRCDIVAKLKYWGRSYDVENIYVETNGLVGIDFYDYCINSDIPVSGWISKGKKYERIMSNFQRLTECKFVKHAGLDEFLAQVYKFAERCEHDDNIDALSGCVDAYKLF